MAMLIYKNEKLIDNMVNVFDDKMTKFVETKGKSDVILEDNCYRDLNYIIHDLDYIGRKDCLKYCIENTNLIPNMIKTISKLYTFDSKS